MTNMLARKDHDRKGLFDPRVFYQKHRLDVEFADIFVSVCEHIMMFWSVCLLEQILNRCGQLYPKSCSILRSFNNVVSTLSRSYAEVSSYS